LFDAVAVAVHYKERLGAFLVIFFEITGTVGAENNSAIRQVCAGKVIERAVGKLFESRAINVNIILMEPVFIVEWDGEENFLAYEGRLGLEYGAGLEMGQPAEFAIGPGRDQGIEIPAGPDRSHGALRLVVRGTAGINVAIAPVVGALINTDAAIGL